MVWYKQGTTPIVYAYKYRSLCYPYLNTNTTPSSFTIHLAEEWTGWAGTHWDWWGLRGWGAWGQVPVPGYPVPGVLRRTDWTRSSVFVKR
eukprot:1015796-Rhodomonas_salina.1